MVNILNILHPTPDLQSVGCQFLEVLLIYFVVQAYPPDTSENNVSEFSIEDS